METSQANDSINPLLIGFCGHGGSGKDAASSYLARYHDFVVDRFTAAQKFTLWKLNPLVSVPVTGVPVRVADLVADPDDDAAWERAKRVSPDVRVLLQRIGDLGRELVDEGVWSRPLAARCSERLAAGRSTAVSGVRFADEIETLRQVSDDALVVWVERPGVAPANDHAMENSIGPDDADVVVDNDGSLRQFHDRLDDLVVGWGGAALMRR